MTEDKFKKMLEDRIQKLRSLQSESLLTAGEIRLLQDILKPIEKVEQEETKDAKI